MSPARGFRPLLLLVMALLLGAASAQTQWSNVPFSSMPPATFGIVAHDSLRDRMVAIGNTANGPVTYEFDGLAWAAIVATTPAFPVNLCYDPVRQAVVNVCNFPPETWEWRGQSWNMITNQNPPFFAYAPMVFHARRGTIMRFGGLSGIAGSPTNELWELVGNTWHFIADPNPPVGHFGTLAYDSQRDKLVVYGTYNPTPQQPTWEWDSATGWQPGPPTGPVFIESNLAYDESRRTLVVCGYGVTGPIQTWERESNSVVWTFRVNASVFSRGLVYDPLRRRILMGGASIQAYAPVFPATLDTFAPGCPGSLGVPSQELTSPWSRAWLGDTLDVTLRGLPTSVGIQVLGFSATSSGGLPLPADLTPFGAPGCHLRVAVDGYSILAGSNHECRFTATVPNVSALRGVVFALQAVAPEPGWNAAGLVMSDAVFGLIGSR